MDSLDPIKVVLKVLFDSVIEHFTSGISSLCGRIVAKFRNKSGLYVFIYKPTSKKKGDRCWESFEALYNRHFKEENGDPPTDEIFKWITDTYNLKRPYPNAKPLDFLVLAEAGTKVCGFLKMTYYHKSNGLAYVSYLSKMGKSRDFNVNRQLESIAPELLRFLERRMHKELEGCVGFVADIALDREDLFRSFRRYAKRFLGSNLWDLANCHVKFELPSVYGNPELTSNSLKPSRLIYVRTRNHPKFRDPNRPDSNEIKYILNFVYNKLYAESFPEDLAKSKQYEVYCHALYDRVWANFSKSQACAG